MLKPGKEYDDAVYQGEGKRGSCYKGGAKKEDDDVVFDGDREDVHDMTYARNDAYLIV